MSGRENLKFSLRWRLLAGGLFVLLGTVSLVVGSFWVNWGEILVWLQERRHSWQGYVGRHPYLTGAVFFAVYVLFAGLALPGAMVLTLAGGALFGWCWGVVLVSFASSAGATLAMLLSRFLLRDWVNQRYGDRLRSIHAELEQAGGWYLLSLRLNPAIPFFLINLAFGLTRISTWRFWWISQLGMLPATLLYVWAGAELDRALESGQLIQPRLLFALLAISLLPVLLRWWTRHRGLSHSLQA